MRTQALGGGWVAQSQSATAPFRLHRATTTAEASELLTRYREATVAAGCSDLVARMREGEEIARLVSIARIPELQAVSFTGSTLRIGSTLTHHAGSADPAVVEAIPGFARAWSQIATVRIRYTGTIGGNVMARRHRYEMPLMLGALGARNVLDDSGRLLTAIEIDTSDLVWFGYERSMRPTTTVALAIRRDGADGFVTRAVVGSEYRGGYVLEAPGCDREVAGALAAQLPDECADYAGSAQYRRKLVAVLAGRLLAAAAREENPDDRP
ncbi:dehydrogenase [Rhodococcus rhodnii]|uniref:FAD-binding PCMH-type domain-containing protein n=2 Tax=Rhodococcus rhodnii TaxID=38312 RepID=R7WHA7_9NOCA|nr:FAD binding domain-containing protein [Rhodococcus rhodnii]EOM74493.1 hypothetical protein Rrhod_4296 [Rhodococcus rhodnii LMG 5362]TXG89181.1 dehydrogenase [Rhodococcus rhodnii]